MPANAGTIEAQLILNASQFQKQMQAAMASAQSATKGMATGSQAVTQGMNNAAKSVQTYTNSVKGATTQATYMGKAIGGTVNQLTGMNKAVNTAASSFSNMGNAYKNAVVPVATTTQKLSSTLSSVGSAGSAAFGKVSSGIMTAGNSLAALTNSVVSFNVWMGALVGMAFYNFTVGAALAVDEAKSLFKFVGMSAGEVDRLDQSTAKYAESASKVSQPEMLSGWRLIRLSHKLSADQMTQYNGVLGDTIGLFKANGRTAEDAGRAIEDAMAGGSDGIKRLKEIGISDMQELYDRGFDPSKPETFFAALQKLYQDKGIEGYGSKVTSLSDRFENLKEKIQLAGVAAGEALMPGMEALVNGLTAIFEGLGPQVSGAIIAFTGLATILGFFWPTLVTIGSGASVAAGKIVELAGGTLKYKTAADGAKTSSIAWGDTLGGLNKRMIAAAAGVGTMAAALVGVAYLIGQDLSATVAWNKVEEDRKRQSDAFTNTIQNLTDKKARLIAKREELISQGKDVADINREISDTEIAITSNTNASAAATERYNDAVAIKKGLETLGQTRNVEAEASSTASAKEIVGPEYADSVGDPNYGVAETKIAEAEIRKSAPRMIESGTFKRIEEGTDAYSNFWKTNQKGFLEYKTQYDEFIVSNDNFQEAIKEGKPERIIWFGLESAFAQADVGIMEFQASIQSWWAELKDGWTQSGKDAEKSVNNIKEWFGGLGTRLGELWGETTSYISGAWGNTVAFFQNGINWISTGFSGAVAWIQGAWNNATAWIQGAWSNTVSAVTNNPLIAQISDRASGTMDWLKQKWDEVRNYVASLPIVGQFISNSGPSVPAIRATSTVGNIASAAQAAINRARASQGPGSDSFLNMASGFKYLAYGGIGQSIAQTLSSASGNCVDGSFAQIALANAWGIPAELIQTTWMGNPHVYARIAGQDRDIANHALTGSWRAPPRGPSGSGSGNIIIQGDVYGYNDFVKKVEQANSKLIRRY